MKEYVVLELKCDKDLTIADIYAKVTKRVVHNRNSFFVDSLHVDGMRDSNKCRYGELYDELKLEQYMYTVTLKNRPEHPWHLLSNLDASWEWYNPNASESLPREQFEKLIDFFDNLKAMDLNGMLMAFDEISWDGSRPEKGTYGYAKADNRGLYLMNYLSNAVVLRRTYKNKQYEVYITCEKRFRELAAVQELAESLGKIKREVIHWAPESDAEREEWNRIAAEAEIKFKNAVAGLETLPLEKYEKHGTAGFTVEKDAQNRVRIGIQKVAKIDVQKYVKGFLCTDGWQKRKALPDELPTIVSKDKGDAAVSVEVDIRHNGHDVSLYLQYRSKMFKYSQDSQCIYDAYPDQMDIFFRNAVLIRDYLYETL